MSLDDQPASLEDVQSMCAVMAHRGPDDEGFFVGSGVALGMRRLSIIDVDTTVLPIANEDRTVWVVFNGEIYNFQSLRQELIARGHVFATRTDTEVLVHLYEEHGPDLLQKLRGMFCFALWDHRRKKLLLARDRLGIKPLYYTVNAGRLVFASELKALLSVPGIDRDINWSAVRHLFTSLTTPRADSIIAGIRKLEPAHVLTTARGQGPRATRYWDVRFEPDRQATEDDLVDRLRTVLTESVRLHMVSDVPVGAFLSGGIDSSAVVATMASLTTQAVNTFSIGFHEQDFNELPHARAVADRFATSHRELVLEPDILDLVDDLVWHLDEPFGDASAIPTYMVSRLASHHVKVVLSGDGGDELFGGYDKYRVEQRERGWRPLPGPVQSALARAAQLLPEGLPGRNFLYHRSLTGWDRYLDASTLFRTEAAKRLFRPEIFERFAADDPWHDARMALAGAGGDWLSAVQYLDLRTYLPLDILTKVDRMSMAHSLEVRVPLLDHELVEFAASIPPHLKLAAGAGKHIFRRAMRDILPDGVLTRRKQGFAVPLGHWFRGRLEGFVRDLLLAPGSRPREIFQAGYIERLLRLNKRGRALDLQLWTLISFALWCRLFLDGRAWARDPGPSRQSQRCATPSAALAATGPT